MISEFYRTGPESEEPYFRFFTIEGCPKKEYSWRLCVIGEAGVVPLGADELVRLQKIIVGDNRFVHIGLRGHP